jgi:hypothetical protein
LYSFGVLSSGEGNYSSKLTNTQTIEIYNLAWNTDLYNYEIGKMYNIGSNAVSKIKRGITWSHATHHNEKINCITKEI